MDRSGITVWWVLLGVLIGISVMVIVQLPLKWSLTLFGGMLVFFGSLATEDKKRFYLVLLMFGLIFLFSKTFLFRASPVFRSTFGYTVYSWVPPLVILYLIWAFRQVTRVEHTPISTSGLWWLAGVFAMASISTLLGNRLYGSFDLFGLALSSLLFIYVASEIDARWLKFILGFLVLVTLIEAIIAISQNLTGSSLGLEFFGARKFITGYVGLLTLTRVTGTFGHPSGLAEFFDLTLPLGVSMLFFPMKKGLKLLLLAAILIEFIGLGMTYSRGGIIAVLTFSGLILLVNFCKRLGMARGAFAAIALGAFMTLLILTVPNPLKKGLFRTEVETAYGRIPLMEVAFNMIRAHPWFGVGLNNYVPVAKNYDFTPEHYTTAWNTGVHNVYLFITGEIGIFGLIFFLGFIVSVIRVWIPVLRSADPLIFCGGLGVGAGLGAYMLHWFSDLTPWTTASMFWFLMGLAVSTGRMARNLAVAPEKRSMAVT